MTGGINGGVHCTDVTNASRTMLMNLVKLQWDPFCLKFFNIPEKILPKIRSSSEIYGNITDGILQGVPISGVSWNLFKEYAISYLKLFLKLLFKNFTVFRRPTSSSGWSPVF